MSELTRLQPDQNRSSNVVNKVNDLIMPIYRFKDGFGSSETLYRRSINQQVVEGKPLFISGTICAYSGNTNFSNGTYMWEVKAVTYRKADGSLWARLAEDKIFGDTTLSLSINIGASTGINEIRVSKPTGDPYTVFGEIQILNGEKLEA